MSDKICKNCNLYNQKERTCAVNIVKYGELFELVTNPNDECFWLKHGIEVNQISVSRKGQDRIIQD